MNNGQDAMRAALVVAEKALTPFGSRTANWVYDRETHDWRGEIVFGDLTRAREALSAIHAALATPAKVGEDERAKLIKETLETLHSLVDEPDVDEGYRAAVAVVERLLSNGRADGAEKERIVRAAIKIGLAVYSVAQPGRHGDALMLLPTSEFAGPDDQGFLTSTGRFVQRKEARQIAEAAGQLLPNARDHSELFSEDVWESPSQPKEEAHNQEEGK